MDARLQWFAAVLATPSPSLTSTIAATTTTDTSVATVNATTTNNEQSISRFLKNRQSARRAFASNRSCSEESNNNNSNHTNSNGGGGGFGRWLREHLTVSHHHSKSNNEKQLSKHQFLPTQNLYCSLPRERPTAAAQRRASCRIVNEQQIQDDAAKRKAKAKVERRRHSMSEIHSSRRARRCYPDGGEVGRKMTTELQPSPPGYRQDATECPSTKLYRGYSNNHHHQQQQHHQVDYIQQPRRKGSPETTNNEINGKIIATDERYEEQSYGKKNAPGYKNDSGYSESLGFESFSLPLSERDAASPPPTPPVRDASSLKAVCYGPGHEKYPSWPSAPECRYPSTNSSSNNDDDDNQQQHAGGSHRSKSWTDHTNYPKEKPAQYTRPHTKRPNSTFTQQLKTVMERCEKIPAETFELRNNNNNYNNNNHEATEQPQRMWPTVDREGKSLGDSEYMVPSPPERESLQSKALSPADLEAYVRSYQDPQVYVETTELTQTGLDEYTTVQHSQQASYAQSEGYHSYVSSVDSTTTTPFLDRLRRDSEAVTTRPLSSWEDGSSREGRDSVVTTSSGSASSSETLKWHGSMSDVSVSSGIPRSTQDRWHHGSMSDLSSINGAPPMSKHEHDENHRPNMSKSFHALANDEWDGSKQLIAHSARVQTPQRHHSESVLYLERSQRKLYPVSTTKLDEAPALSRLPTSPQQTQPTVAERISELEKQQQYQQQMMRYTYLDPEKRHRVSDPTLKAIQKKALLSFYERHQHQASWRSEPHLIQNQQQQTQQQRHSPPPQPPPRPRPVSSRRASSASDYATGAWREKNAASKACQQQPVTCNNSANGTSASNGVSEVSTPRHQHSNSCGSLSTDLLGPVIVGSAISIDDWVPERPPKKPHLRTAYSERLPSPDLPPPSPPTVTDIEVHNFDDPLPPPPPELSQNCVAESRLSTSPEQRHDNSYLEESPHDRIKDRNSTSRRSSRKKLQLEPSPTTSPTKLKPMSPNHEQQQSFHLECKTVLPASIAESKPVAENGFASSSRILSSTRSSLRYSPAQKHLMNEKIAAVRRSAESGYNLSNQLPDLIAQKYSDSGHQRPAPQVPVVNNIACREAQVEPKIKRQDSLKLDDSPSKSHQPWLSGQKPRTQVATVTSPTSSRLSNKYQQQARNYFALPAKYSAESSEAPPPLAPRKKISPPPRPAPPVHAVQGSQSKASYLAYRRERGAPDCEGSYKRTMSPNARLDDPVLLKVTPHTPPSLIINNNNNNNNNNNHNNSNNNNSQQQPRYHRHELSKSQSSDALSNGNGHRMDDHFSRKSLHNVSSPDSNSEKRERLSPQSVEVLNDRNRQLERERRKLAASCEPPAQNKFVEEFYRDSGVTTIEMTSQNVEMLNRRNVAEKQRIATGARSPNSTSPKFTESPASPTVMITTGTTTTSSPAPSERKISSPAQTEQTGSNWDRKSTNSCSSNNSSNPSSPIRISPSSRISPTIEGLTLVQRTEVVLRVNATTNDVASQTEELDEKKELESLAKPRKKLQEEIECEELSRDLANQLGPNDKLLPILVPVPEHKKSTDYVVDLFRVETALQPRPRPRLTIEDPSLLDGSENESECDKKIDSIPSTPVTPSTPSAADSPSSTNSNSPLSANSVYFTTSESKARFLTRYSQDVTPPVVDSTPDSLDLRQKKEELMVRLDKKLVVLRAEQEAVREEGEVNEALGARVATRVASVARPTEASKYRLHVEEVGKITSLLLGLSGRLARAENALYGMSADHPERKILESKRDKLIDQLEEAKNLKGNIDRRSVSVSAILAKYLSDDEYADYQHFINMKAKLIVDGREIQDKVKLGEEQLAALKEAIDL